MKIRAARTSKSKSKSKKKKKERDSERERERESKNQNPCASPQSSFPIQQELHRPRYFRPLHLSVIPRFAVFDPSASSTLSPTQHQISPALAPGILCCICGSSHSGTSPSRRDCPFRTLARRSCGSAGPSSKCPCLEGHTPSACARSSCTKNEAVHSPRLWFPSQVTRSNLLLLSSFLHRMRVDL